MQKTAICLGALLISLTTVGAEAQSGPRRDEFFWLGEINKASAVINTDEGLLDRAVAPRIAAGLRTVLHAGEKPGGKRPTLVITFEPLLIEAAGVEATLLHAGRSSQDMLATVRAAIIRDEVLTLAEQLRKTTATMVALAEKHAGTIVPNYTNGVAAQPNSYGHYLLGHVAGLQRDAERLRQFYARLDRSPMGTTVLNGTSWPLNRPRMANYLGFAATVDNAYDAAQISATEIPVELGAVTTAIALHAGAYIQDVMVQYAQPRPWILLQEGGGNTYVSSAMPQKRNPGLLNDVRGQASSVVSLGIGRAIQAHNIPPGMNDAKNVGDNAVVVGGATRVLAGWDRILGALAVNPERALEELNSDWTASQEVADVLMRQYKLPFRVGHHFASEVVDYAKAHDIRPSDFPYQEARRIFSTTLTEMKVAGGELPLSEAEFRAALDPVAIIRHRATAGGPQPAEMARMVAEAKQSLAEQDQWIQARRQRIDGALAELDRDFARLGTP
ncbi:argininosuccinate lyase [Tardiphaga sp. vice352]|uniref:argininosuccinate lyase n=1 Tax=unclassified Tardiphaga TaxID=2631404 RepID=UPI001162BD75|nr:MULTISPECIES: argininosuccinate lyase [unclassified Tardiphaga]QDM17753.1 argininosuccinate lyase [Tardiphaga sp. vice278]QDM22812.1 argininosuccinate lyase [Tardiphaga sp. vice154]QDM27972.1 argininosuccinate lyase [Tardiphaga sp. vice304]QDM33115.1 argininosuccinate lyase [Tardiphaga sp. vice352]